MTERSLTRGLCIIPARGGSRRFPRKNLARFRGTPLVGLAVAVAKASGVFQTVCVSSDDAEVLDVARAHGADRVLQRSPEDSAYDRQVKDICVSVVEQLSAEGNVSDLFAVLLPTSPLRTAGDVAGAYRTLLESDADCCMTVVAWDHPPQRALRISDGRRLAPFFGPEYLKPAQALETLYRHDGTALVARTQPFLHVKGFYELPIVPYRVSADRGVDVDSPRDLAWAEFLATRLAIRLRPATMADEARLLLWRNDPHTRAMSFSQDAVSSPDHHRWLERRLHDPRSRLYVAERECGREAVGVGRLDAIDDHSVEVGLTVAPEHRGQGLAHPIIEALVDQAVRGELGPRQTVVAYVRTGNEASLNAFTSASFQRDPNDLPDRIRLSRTLNRS